MQATIDIDEVVVFGCHYKPAYKLIYKTWYGIFLSQQISRTNQHKLLYEQPAYKLI